MDNDLGFILQNWGAISVFMYTLSLIAIIFAIVEKVGIWNKILNILIITFIPFIGWLVYLLIRVCRKHKKKVIVEAHTQPS